MPILGSFHHVHIISEDPEAAAEWYAGVFGAEITASVERRGARNVSMRLGGAGLYVRGIRESDEIAAPEKSRPLGIHHIGFQGEDAEATDVRLQAAACPPREEINHALNDSMGSGHGGRNVEIKYKGPDGVMIDVSQSGWVGTDSE